MRRRGRHFGRILVLVVAGACGGGAGSADSAGDTALAPGVGLPQREVIVTRPAEGAVVDGPSLSVVMGARGFSVVAAGDTTPNSGHLHLFLDRDLSPADVPIPTEPGFIIHMGTGASEYTFESVAPGEHRLIAVVGDALHVPLQPWVVDTVRFTVR